MLMLSLTLSSGFQSAKMRERTKKMREATSYLNVPNYGSVESSCAACEAVAQGIEAQMRTDQHKNSAVVRTALLMSACDGIDDFVPSELNPIEKDGPKVLNFVNGKKTSFGQERNEKYVSVGLSEFCNMVVEEYEDELSAVMDDAKPVDSALTKSMKGAARYEMKQAVCVHTTSLCTDEALNRISAHRMNLINEVDPEMKKKFAEVMAQMQAGKAGMPKISADVEVEHKNIHLTEEMLAQAEADEKAGKPVTEGAKRAKGAKKDKSTKGKKDKKAAADEFWSMPTNPAEMVSWAQASPMLASVAGLTTVSVVYVGGMVARLW